MQLYANCLCLGLAHIENVILVGGVLNSTAVALYAGVGYEIIHDLHIHIHKNYVVYGSVPI
jgi:hypothetical protein